MKFAVPIFVSFAVLSVGFGETAALICGDKSSAKTISIAKPLSPPNVCEYKIESNSKKICQMRIDFSMTLAQPEFPSSTNGLSTPECVADYLSVGDFKLCGVENSQHIYVPINRTAGMDSLKIIFKVSQRKGLSNLPPLSWDLTVTQIECPAGIGMRSTTPETFRSNGQLLAPIGCHQFYPENQGTIRSFNYNSGKGIYPFNLDYVICFRRTTVTAGLLIKAEEFNLPQEPETSSNSTQTDSSCYPQLPSKERVEDYLMIPHSQIQENEIRANYFCGQSINGLNVLSTNPGPLSMIFHSGAVYRKENTNLGFSLNYQIVSK